MAALHAIKHATVLAAMLAGGAQVASLTDDPNLVKVCALVGSRTPPDGQRPTVAQTQALKGCNPEALYYGEGGTPDPVKARLCAFALDDGRAPGEGGEFNSAAILAEVYANGLGVPRDIDQALAYACRKGNSDFDRGLRSLLERRAHPVTGRFDYCSDLVTEREIGACALRDERIAESARSRALHSLTAGLSPAAQASFRAAQRAMDAYAVAYRVREAAYAEKAWGSWIVESERIDVREPFARDVERLLRAQWPAVSAGEVAKADAKLSAAHRRWLAADLSPQMNNVADKRAGSRTVQRLWLVYRKAFVRFAQAARPNISSGRIIAELSRERAQTLDDLAAEP